MPSAHRPLTESDLLSGAALHRLGRQVYIHETIDSTNAFLLREAASAGDGALAWTESQTAGRGRLGRRWEAPRGSSILLSVLLLEPPDSSLLARAALLGAVAACEAIETVTDCTPSVRWPNDLVLDGRKLGGILAESGSTGHQWALVIGIGINCLQHRGHFSGPLAETATSLECMTSHPVERPTVAAALVARLDAWLVRRGETPQDWAELHAVWQARCADIGTRVTLEQDGRRFTGTVLDISPQADLIVQLDHGGRRHFDAATTTRPW